MDKGRASQQQTMARNVDVIFRYVFFLFGGELLVGLVDICHFWFRLLCCRFDSLLLFFLRFSCVIMIRSWNKNYWCQTINTCSIKAKRSNGKCTQANASGDIDISSVWMKYLFELAIGSILLWIRCAFEANTKQQPTNKHKCIYRTKERKREGEEEMGYRIK